MTPNPGPEGIAAGHNPDQLTNAQVGVQEGWRLLEENEIITATIRGRQVDVKGVEAWSNIGWFARDVGMFGNDHEVTYRTKLSPAELRAARGLTTDQLPEPTESVAAELSTINQGGDASCAPDSASTPAAPHTEWSAPASNASASNAAPESNPPAAAEVCQCGHARDCHHPLANNSWCAKCDCTLFTPSTRTTTETCRCGDVLPASDMVDTPKGRMCRNCEAGLPDAAVELRALDEFERRSRESKRMIRGPQTAGEPAAELDALRKRVAELEAVIRGEVYETKALKSREELEKQLAAKEAECARLRSECLEWAGSSDGYAEKAYNLAADLAAATARAEAAELERDALKSNREWLLDRQTKHLAHIKELEAQK